MQCASQIKTRELSYTFLADDNRVYGRKVLRDCLIAYFGLLQEVKPDLQFKDLKRAFSMLVKSEDKSRKYQMSSPSHLSSSLSHLQELLVKNF